ncbi:MAG: glycosyltransferase family 2 protein [Deferribacteraceae bacterium]|jgi:hypothetical protein|nr:glycosyltransferase family 2 protein [Deferribacteraceae bacterium]
MSEPAFNPCVVIPVYKHAYILTTFISKIGDYPIIIVDDGNPKSERELLNNLLGGRIFILTLLKNKGKGAAVVEGLKKAIEKGYTHALQIDADAQHDLSAITLFFNEAEANPEALINAYPVYDATAAAARKAGRKLTNFFVELETAPNAIKDAMCGFRVYPLAQISKIIDRLYFKRMGFDIEIIVKAYRYRIDIINMPVKVVYPKGGYSNFRLILDNLKISLLHAYLVTTMLLGAGRKDNASSS